MIGQTLVVAALLLTGLSKVAAAAEIPEHPPGNANKTLVVLESMGLNNGPVRELISDVDSRIHDGYLRLAEERVPGGTLVLHYELSGGARIRQLELRYTPDGSNFTAAARPNGAMINYRFKF